MKTLSVLQSVQRCFEKKSRVAVKMVVTRLSRRIHTSFRLASLSALSSSALEMKYIVSDVKLMNPTTVLTGYLSHCAVHVCKKT